MLTVTKHGDPIPTGEDGSEMRGGPGYRSSDATCAWIDACTGARCVLPAGHPPAEGYAADHVFRTNDAQADGHTAACPVRLGVGSYCDCPGMPALRVDKAEADACDRGTKGCVVEHSSTGCVVAVAAASSRCPKSKHHSFGKKGTRPCAHCGVTPAEHAKAVMAEADAKRTDYPEAAELARLRAIEVAAHNLSECTRDAWGDPDGPIEYWDAPDKQIAELRNALGVLVLAPAQRSDSPIITDGKPGT